MNCLLRTTAILFLTMTCLSGIAQNDENDSPDFLSGASSKEIRFQPTQFKIGFNLGWGFPYSAGVEFSMLFHELFDVNVGGGVGLSGWKYGAGARFYPMRDSKVSPMIGGYLYHATGIKALLLFNKYEDAEYQITADNAFLLNGGMRLRFGRGNYFTVAVGHIFPFEGEQAKYLNGSRDRQLRNRANSLATSGLSINVGILIKLSRGHYEL